MLKKIFAVSVIVFMTVFSSIAPALDNSVGQGAKKVEGGVKAVGKSAEEFGTKAGKAAEGAAKDTGNALSRAWDNIVRGLRKAFK